METKKELLEQSQKAMGEFMELARYLLSEDAPMEVTEIPEDNPFYQTARDIADDMGLKWDSINRGDNARVMLNLLSEYFCAIKPDADYEPVLTITFKKK